jgi:four helix bundle protein
LYKKGGRAMSQGKFSFEDLDIWKKAVEFARVIIDLTEVINTERKHLRLINQLESAVTSVALNIAEGSGRYSRKEFVHFLYIARGSLYETITLLTIFKSNNWITEQQFLSIKNFSQVIARMLSGLINSLKKP